MSALGSNGSTRHWRRLRTQILRRDMWICHWCHGFANTVDHLVPRIEGGSDHPANLVAACQRCNSQRSLAWVKQHRRGVRRGSSRGGTSATGVLAEYRP